MIKYYKDLAHNQGFPIKLKDGKGKVLLHFEPVMLFNGSWEAVFETGDTKIQKLLGEQFVGKKGIVEISQADYHSLKKNKDTTNPNLQHFINPVRTSPEPPPPTNQPEPRESKPVSPVVAAGEGKDHETTLLEELDTIIEETEAEKKEDSEGMARVSSLREMAKILGLDRSVVRYWMEKKDAPKSDGGWLVHEVQKYIEEGRAKSKSKKTNKKGEETMNANLERGKDKSAGAAA